MIIDDEMAEISMWREVGDLERIGRIRFPHAVQILSCVIEEWCEDRFGPNAWETKEKPMGRVDQRIIFARSWWLDRCWNIYHFKDPKHAMEVKLRFS